jgi:TolA-binding protein
VSRRGAQLILAWLLLLCFLVTAPLAQQQDVEDDAYKLARNLFRDAGDHATAAELFAEFIRNYPESQHLADARLMLARAYGRSGRCAEAVPAYETFYQEHAEHLNTAQARRERAACLGELGKHQEAAQAYGEIHRRFSASGFAPEMLLQAGANYTAAGMLEQAEAAYGKVIADYARTAGAHTARFRLARLLFAGGHADAAQSLLAQIAAAEPAAAEAPGALLLAGRIDLFVGKQDAAAALFARLQQRFAESAQADSSYLEQADHLFRRRQYMQAGEAYLAAHERISAPELKLQALLSLADSRRLSRLTQEALQHYQDLLALLPAEHPSRPQARLGLAIALGQTGQFGLAVGMLQELRRTSPDSPAAETALRELGALYSRRGDHQLAISWYRRYLQDSPDAADREQVRFALAGIYSDSGDFEAATELYQALADSRGPWSPEAQFGLAQTCEAGGQRRRALREYLVLLEQFPASRRGPAARERVEYLREFTLMDAEGLNRAVQQAWLDELSGSPRQLVQLGVARALHAHHDFSNAVRLFEHYVAVYHGGPYSAEAQLLLAESLLKLARQRQLEGQEGKLDSLRELALKEYRILSRHPDGGIWTQQAELQLLQLQAGTRPDSSALVAMVDGLDEFVSGHESGPLVPLALLRQGDAQRQLGSHDQRYAESAVAAYSRLIEEYPASPHVPAALFGVGVCQARLGALSGAELTLSRILEDYPSSSVSPQVLHELGQLLLRQQRYPEARARLEELRWAYPTFAHRRGAQEQLADIHYVMGEYGDAVALYQQLIDGQLPSAETQRLRRRLAAAYHLGGQLQSALDIYRALSSAAEIGTIDAAVAHLDSVYFAAGQLLEELGQVEEAAAQYARVQGDFGESPLAATAAARAADLLFGLGRYQEAFSLYQPQLDTTEDPRVHGQAVLALFRLGRAEEARGGARDFARRFGKESDWNQRFQLEEGQLLLAANRYERALGVFQDVAKTSGEWSDDGAYYAALVRWELNTADPSPEAAARALEAQARFVAKHGDSPHAASVHLRLGNYHYYLHNYLQAAGSYKRVIELTGAGPLAEEAIWRLLSCYQGAHEYDEAHRVAEMLLRQFPGHPQARAAELEIGIILKEKGQYSRAIDQLQRTLEWAQGNQASEARYYIGEAYQNMGEYRKAIEAYYRVSYHGADGFSQWITSADYRRAQCHESLKEYATAVTVYQRIVQREGSDSPQGRLANERLTALKSLLGAP